MCHVDGNVEPLSGFGPANIEQICGRNNFVEGIVVNRIRLSVEFRVGSIYALMDTKLVQIAPISRIQLSAAVILRIRVVIRDPFTTQVIVGAQYSSRYFLWAATISGVVIRRAFVLDHE
jgi:hypothetical protein